ncbi:MAG: hypothetical protein AAF637_18295 [Pseudomonadota bacterium]
MEPVRGFIKQHNMELQFWGYEGGNVLATVAGAGGFGAFTHSVGGVWEQDQLNFIEKCAELSATYPDALVTIGLGALVLLAPVLRHAADRRGIRAVNLVDLGVTMLGLAILGYALSHDTSWIAVSASSFVVASAFLRQCKNNPFLMKAGGLALAVGGTALAFFGLDGLAQLGSHSESMQIALGILTAGTGLYVVGASLLTYEGGIYATSDFKDSDKVRPKGWVSLLIHPVKGLIADLFTRLLDRPITWVTRHLVNPAIFWASRKTRRNRPFATSMWARLPWRIITGGVALATGTPQGIAFGLANVGWAIGDLSIGSLDWED